MTKIQMTMTKIETTMTKIGTTICSSIRAPIGSFQDGRHGPKMAARPQDDHQDPKMVAMTSDDPVTRSVSPRGELTP